MRVVDSASCSPPEMDGAWLLRKFAAKRTEIRTRKPSATSYDDGMSAWSEVPTGRSRAYEQGSAHNMISLTPSANALRVS